MNFTALQYDILRRLVTACQAKSAEFYFTHGAGGGYLMIPGLSPAIRCDESDLRELGSQGAVTLISGDGQYRGKPTQLGIDLVRDGAVRPSAEEALEELPQAARGAVSQLVLETDAERLEFDRIFQEKFAETPSLDLLERYCLGRFDLMADRLLITSVSVGSISINPQYEAYLDAVQQRVAGFAEHVLQALRADVREEILSRIRLKLSSRKLYWLREATNWHLKGHPPRSPFDAIAALTSPVASSGEGLDEYLRRIADELDRRQSNSETKRTGQSMGPETQRSGTLEHPRVEPDPDGFAGAVHAEDPVVRERRQLLAKFKERGRALGIRVTDELVAHAANPNWNDRTMVTWWKRKDPRCKPAHDRLIRAALLKDPS